jgi:hypothetical protein
MVRPTDDEWGVIPVERASETVERCAEGKERIGECRADKLASVRRDVTTLVVTEDIGEF